MVDHRDHETLDNRKSNLRLVNHIRNGQNRKGPSKHNKSGFRNVYWNKCKGKWRVEIVVNKKRIYIGDYDDKQEAAKVASEARKKFFAA